MRVLVTGGRAPATLDLVRRLHDGGAEVHLAESLQSTVTSFSNCLTQVHGVPPPRQQPDAFVDALRAIVRSQKIDLLIPTCEETFWVARAPDLPTHLEPLDRLRRVHHKGEFAAWCAELELGAPASRVASDSGQLHAAVRDFGGANKVVVKPCFSRFGTRVMIRPRPEELARVRATPEAPWVVQRWVSGPVVCSWSMAHEGRVTAHSAYRARFTAGVGSAVHFAALPDGRVRDWVESFAAQTGWTGQLAFDFVMCPGGPVALECNPRLTSGVHLLPRGPGLLESMASADATLLIPEPGAQAQIAAAMLLYGLPSAFRSGELGGWISAFFRSREVSWQRGDSRPFWSQGRSILALYQRSKKVNERLLDATTYDIRWDGEQQ